MNASRILGMDYYMAYEPFRDILAELVKINAWEQTFIFGHSFTPLRNDWLLACRD